MKHFPRIEEITEWTNEYTGKTMRAADGVEGEKQANFSQNREGISRRNAFFHPKPIKRVKEEESVMGEVDMPDLKKTFKFVMPSSTIRHASAAQYAEPQKEPEYKRPVSLNSTKSLNVSKEIKKQSLEFQSEQEHNVSLKNPLLNEKEGKKSSFVSKASAFSDPKQKFDETFDRETLNVGNYLAQESKSDSSKVDDLLIEILSHRVGESKLAQSCADFALKLAIESKPIQKDKNEDIAAETIVDFTSKEETLPSSRTILSHDILFSIKKSKKDWKNDDLEQVRAGSWAVDMVSKTIGPVTTESLKPDALKALGRLALQSLHMATASQSHDLDFSDDEENERTTLDLSLFRSKLQQLANLHDLMKDESFRTDLQSLQDGLFIEKSADEVLESFLETLRKETDPEQKVPKDVLLGKKALSKNDIKLNTELHSTKITKHILDLPSKGSKVHFKEDQKSAVESTFTFDTRAKEIVQSTDKYIAPRKGFSSLEIDADQVVRESFKSNY